MITFKQFLVEGGKATKEHGTVRANKADIQAVLKLVSKVAKVPVETLADRLLGSTRLTFNGHQKDSGDIDIALENTADRDAIVKNMTAIVQNEPYIIGGNIFSFAVPASENKKVQVDLMFLPDIEWAKFSHYASEHSKHKSGVRNELLHSALKWSMEPGKDVRLKDDNGNDIARASRSYKLDQGVERIFKVAPKKKDGSGRVKGAVKTTPDAVKAALDQEGFEGSFEAKNDPIRDPDRFAKLLFGPKALGKDLMSTEQLINMIKKHKAKDAPAIFKDAVQNIKRLKFPVPDELKQFE
jgi:hypothetical protein